VTSVVRVIFFFVVFDTQNSLACGRR